jgi:hypothetical protein
VVVKAYQRQWGRSFLEAVGRVQGHLAEAGFPCPHPLVSPGDAGPALATVEDFVPDPGMAALSGDLAMAVSAQGLAAQIEHCRALSEPDLQRHPLGRAGDGLYPQPHNPLFDFSRRENEAAWIDRLAAAAVTARDRHRLAATVAHTDWSARNIRIDRDRVVVAYD